MEQTALLNWILALPLAGAAVILLLGTKWPRTLVAGIASGAVGLSFVATVLALTQIAGGKVLHSELLVWSYGGSVPIRLGLLGDPLSLWFMTIVTGVGFLIHVYSAGYMAGESGPGRYFASLNLFIFTMGLLILSDGFIGLLMGWAGVGLSSFLLIGFHYERPAAVAASRKAFVINTIGDAGIILALLIMFPVFGALDYAGVFSRVDFAMPSAVRAIALLLFIGAIAKSAQLPLHTWLPDAMQGPTPVSALIHAATMVTAGVYLVARCYPLYQAAPEAAQVVAVVGGLTALVGASMAIVQFDIKRVLAFSTMSQVGYMILATGVGAYAAGVFHFFTHAFFKALLFLSAGLVIHFLGGEQDIRKMRGLAKRLPVAYWTFLIGTLSLAGAPLFSGFFSKDEVLGSVFNSGHLILWLVGVVTAGLTAFYMVRLFLFVFGEQTGSAKTQKREADVQASQTHQPGFSMTLPVWILAALAVVSGYLAVPGVINVPERFLGPVFAQYGAPTIHGFSIVSLVVALGAAAVGAWWGLRQYGTAARVEQPAHPVTSLLQEGYYFDALYRTLVTVPLAALGGWLGRVFDPAIIGGSAGAAGGLALAVGRGLRSVQTGYIRRYALAMFIGAAAVVAYVVWTA